VDLSPVKSVRTGGRRWLPTVWVVMLAVLLSGCASLVEFPSAHPGGARRALAIPGVLTKPKGDGPCPAVDLLHGCSGVLPNHSEWASGLSADGYVTLLIDSHKPRGITSTCVGATASGDRVWDALGALRYLRSLPFVAGERIGVMGWSEGGIVALRTSSDLLATYAINAPGFRAAVAFYPGCSGNLSSSTTAAVLLLLGEKDDWTSPIPCVQIAKELQETSHAIEYVVYPNATHAFDEPALRTGVNYLGYQMRYDATATSDSAKRIKVFLHRHLRAE
jgi:dienelactone hydrolase